MYAGGTLIISLLSVGPGISDTLHEEIAPFGLRSICFDFGCFRTPVLEKRPRWVPVLEAYKDAGEKANTMLLGTSHLYTSISLTYFISCVNAVHSGYQKGDPVRGVHAIINIIKGEGPATGKNIPSGFALGADCYVTVKEHCEDTLARLEEWKEVALSTDYRNQ